MEKQNQVIEGRTPCKVCQGGHSEFVCSTCRASKRASVQDDKLDPEQMEAHHECRRK